MQGLVYLTRNLLGTSFLEPRPHWLKTCETINWISEIRSNFRQIKCQYPTERCTSLEQSLVKNQVLHIFGGGFNRKPTSLPTRQKL